MKIKGVLATSIEVGFKYYCDRSVWIGVNSKIHPERVYLKELLGLRCKAAHKNNYSSLKPYHIGYRDKPDKNVKNWNWAIPRRVYLLNDQN